MHKAQSLLRGRPRRQHRTAHRPEQCDFILNRPGYGRFDRFAGRQAQKAIDKQFLYGQSMRRIARGHRLTRNTLKIPPKAGILPLQMRLNSRILQHDPEILNQTRVRIEPEERSQRRRLLRPTPIPITNGRHQILKRVQCKSIGAKLNMSRLMRRHHQIEPHVLIVRLIFPE